MPTLTQADIKAIVETVMKDELELERWKKKLLAEREAYEKALASRFQVKTTRLEPVEGKKIVKVTR